MTDAPARGRATGIASALVLAVASVSAQELIVNGSFEDGPDLGERGSIPLARDSRAIAGWVVTRQAIDYTGSEWSASHRLHSIDLEGSPGFGGVRQTVPTSPGREYLVSFDLAGNPCSFTRPGIKRMAVAAAGEAQEFSFSTHGRSATDMGWTRQSWTFSAVDESTSIEFNSLEGNWCGAAIDNVSLVLLPEPFLRGDCNRDGETAGTADALFLLAFLFLGGDAPECLAACDANGDGVAGGEVTDAVFLLGYNFLGTAPPPTPFPECGRSELATDRSLGCEGPASDCL